MWLRLVQASTSMDNRLENLIQDGAARHLHKGEPLLLLYHGQISRMLGLQELPSLQNEKDGPPPKRRKRSTNFHSLARDVEREGTGPPEEEEEGKPGPAENEDQEAENTEDFLLGMASKLESAVWRRVRAGLREVKRSAFTEISREWRGAEPGSAFSPVPTRVGGKTITRAGRSLRAIDAGEERGYTDVLAPRQCLAFPNSLAVLPLLPKCETPASPQVLPPTFTTLGSTAQIWCAKCKLSFRMTSDLVLHMRLRHKKEAVAGAVAGAGAGAVAGAGAGAVAGAGAEAGAGAGVGAHGKRPRELQLSCPVCYAYFRERHHLSRHMTSHC